MTITVSKITTGRANALADLLDLANYDRRLAERIRKAGATGEAFKVTEAQVEKIRALVNEHAHQLVRQRQGAARKAAFALILAATPDQTPKADEPAPVADPQQSEAAAGDPTADIEAAT